MSVPVDGDGGAIGSSATDGTTPRANAVAGMATSAAVTIAARRRKEWGDMVGFFRLDNERMPTPMDSRSASVSARPVHSAHEALTGYPEMWEKQTFWTLTRCLQKAAPEVVVGRSPPSEVIQDVTSFPRFGHG